MMRHQKLALISQLVRERNITTQQDLNELLLEHGFECNQSTLSRDLHVLNIRKINGAYAIVDESKPKHLIQLLRSHGRDVSIVGPYMIVIKVATGMAMAIATELDHDDDAAIAGTIAGDDTIFVALCEGANQAALIHRLRKAIASDG